jgi:hypothetical protein
MTDTPPQPHEIQVTPYDDVVATYGLTILAEAGDWSLERADLVMTKDGEPQHGDIAYSGLFRLVQMWRFCEPHLRGLFDEMNSMRAWQEGLNNDMNALGAAKHARFRHETYLRTDPEFAEAFNDICDQQTSATFGASVYAGSLMLMLSGMLLRLRDDIGAKDDWNKVGPFYNGHSTGAIIEAGANGFRHADEWAKTANPTVQQKRSQDVIAGALSGRPPPDEDSPGGCVELLQLLSDGSFGGLASSTFAFAHNLAVKARLRTSPNHEARSSRYRLSP